MLIYIRNVPVAELVVTGFIGYAPEVYALISHHEVEDTDDDQLYYTNLYLDEDLRVRCEAMKIS